MISVSSLTKVYGLGRLRIGWILAREELVRRAEPLYDYTIAALSGPSVALGVAAISRRRDLCELARRRAEENGRMVASWIADRKELEWIRPGTGIIAFPRFSKKGSGSDFASFAQQKHGVLVVPGGFFEDHRGFRIGYGVDTSQLVKALDRLSEALSQWTG